jgi:probable addiction module antidote protein
MSAKVKTRVWDSVEHLRDEDDIRRYIDAALEEAPDDAAFLAAVLGDVARARNIAELARTTGIARETLYKMLRGEGNPTMTTISKLANALGFRISLTPLDTNAKPKPTARSGKTRKAA